MTAKVQKKLQHTRSVCVQKRIMVVNLLVDVCYLCACLCGAWERLCVATVCEWVRVQSVVSQGRSWLQARTHTTAHNPHTSHVILSHNIYIEIDIFLRLKLIIL